MKALMLFLLASTLAAQTPVIGAPTSINGNFSTSGNFSAANLTATAGNVTVGTYSGTAGAKFMSIQAGNIPIQLCPAADSNCATMYYDFTGNSGTGTGSMGHGWDFTGGRQLAGNGDNFWFRNLSANVFGSFTNTSYPAGNMGAFASDHDLLMGGGIGWWNGTLRSKFTPPTVTAARTWTMPDASGSVPVTVATIAPTGPTSSPPTDSNTVYTTPSDATQHLYRACGFLVVTTAGTAGNIYPSYGFTVNGHVFSGADMLGASNILVTTQWNAGGACNTFISDAGTTIQLGAHATGVTGSPQYNISASLELLK